MALNNNLLISWNFDTVTSSAGDGTFTVDDISTQYNGKGINFSANSNKFLLKEDILTGKKQHYDTLEGLDTIQLVDVDDERLSGIEKPSSVRLMVENSMYQIISDEMLNLFASIDNYAFKFSIPNNKYKSEYEALLEARSNFFEKVLNKPNLEKYIEFYKWIDSSLGALIDQLKPENSSDFGGLKTTVESHILERNKYQYPLPITVQSNKIYKNSDRSITVIKSTNAITSSNLSDVLSGTFEKTTNLQNIEGLNFANNYEVVQGASKFVNNRNGKNNKSILQTRFSAVDGLSENNRDNSGEFSVYNETNQRARILRDIFNISQSHATGTQGSNTTPGPTTPNNFQDNAFIQRNIPYTASNYHETGAVYYQAFPNEEAEFRKRNLILIDDIDNQYDVQEAAIEFAVPAKHTIRIKDAFEDIEVYSAYDAKRNTFSPRVLQETGTLKKGFRAFFDRDFSRLQDETFVSDAQKLSDSGIIQIKKYEILENIYPRKDLMGRAETRTKPNYEEEEGTFNTDSQIWSDNSYNNNSADIRSFWRDNVDDRKRTRGADNFPSYTGSYNCLNIPNLSQSDTVTFVNTSSFMFYSISFGANSGSYYTSFISSNKNNPYNNIYSLDSLSNDNVSTYASMPATLNNNWYFSGTYFGDLAPLPHGELVKFLTSSFGQPTPKPQFIYNVFPGYKINLSGSKIYPIFINNLSYQNGLDVKIAPWYNSYETFFENIKNKSQNKAIIPEFAISFNTGSLKQEFSSSLSDNKYLKMLGREKFNKIDETEKYFLSDFNKFIDLKSNKIKISLNGIKKLLPYNGFYPNEFSLQIIKEFNDCFLSSSNLSSYEIQSISQPFFGPGILFNSIKSGLAIGWAGVLTASSNDPSFNEIYNRAYVNAALQSDSPYDRNISVLLTGNLQTIPFETLLNPYSDFFKKYEDYYLYYLDPTHYSDIFTYGLSTGSFTLPKCELKKISSVTDTSFLTYELIINNFLAETVKFFLSKGELTSFISEPDGEFYFEAGKTYGMNIVMKKNKNFSMFKKLAYIDNFLPISSLFGPPVENKANSTRSSNIFSETAYYPYIPHYLKGGESYTENANTPTKITFTTASSGFYSIPQIINNITIDNNLYTKKGVPKTQSLIIDSVNLKQYIPYKQSTFDTITRSPSQIEQQTKNQWVIQTKFESPLIDYTDTIDISLTSSGQNSFGYYRATSSNPEIFVSSASIAFNYLEGIWTSYGNIPKDGQSVQISIDDAGFENSLLKTVGFKKETKSIGKLANNKNITEAVILLPYQEKEGENLTLNKLEGKYLFKIDRNLINTILKVPKYEDIDTEKNKKIQKIKTILETDASLDKNNSIVDLMIKMVNYNVPPHLNWLFDTGIEPFVMYIAEFDHTLDKQDLADIWQGNMPKIAKTPEEQTVTIEHGLFSNELFSGYNINEYDIKMKVFKVKKRAANNYFDLTADVADNNKYKFGGSDNIPWYTYNWPYDYFSLVELVNIQAGEVYDPTATQTTTIGDLQLANTQITNFVQLSPLSNTNLASALLSRIVSGSNT